MNYVFPIIIYLYLVKLIKNLRLLGSEIYEKIRKVFTNFFNRWRTNKTKRINLIRIKKLLITSRNSK